MMSTNEQTVTGPGNAPDVKTYDLSPVELMVQRDELLAAAKIAERNLSPVYSSDHLVMKSLRAAIAKAHAAYD